MGLINHITLLRKRPIRTVLNLNTMIKKLIRITHRTTPLKLYPSLTALKTIATMMTVDRGVYGESRSTSAAAMTTEVT